jgi:hypothetical protein
MTSNSERSAKLTGRNQIYGIKVSKTGKEVTSTDPNDFIMNSEWGTIKFLKWGTATKVVGSSSSESVTITHNAGFYPMVLLFVELTPDSGNWYVAPFSDAKIAPEDVYISSDINDTYSSQNSFTFKIINTIAASKTVKYYYFVIGETGKT